MNSGRPNDNREYRETWSRGRIDCIESRAENTRQWNISVELYARITYVDNVQPWIGSLGVLVISRN